MTHATMLALQVLKDIPVHEPDLQLDKRRACPTVRPARFNPSPSRQLKGIEKRISKLEAMVMERHDLLEFDATAARMFLRNECGLPSCTRCQAEILAALSRRAQKLAKEATP